MLRNMHRPAILGFLLVAAAVLGACAPSNAAPLPTAPTVGAAVATSAAAAPTIAAEVGTVAAAAVPTVQAAAGTAQAALPTVEAALSPAATPSAQATAAPAATAAVAPGATAQGPTVQMANNATLGPILVNNAGMTLYIFKKDTPGVSTCTGGCATIWPPLTVAAGTTPTAAAGIAGKLGVIQRADGTSQVTYNDMPLYLYAGDQKPGQTAGQGLQNLWYVVTVGAAGTTTPAPSSTTSY